MPDACPVLLPASRRIPLVGGRVPGCASPASLPLAASPAACLCLPGLPSAFPIFLFFLGQDKSPCSCPPVPCPESLLLCPPQRFVFLPAPPERGRATRRLLCPKHQGGCACPASAQLLVHRANVSAYFLQGTLHWAPFLLGCAAFLAAYCRHPQPCRAPVLAGLPSLSGAS